MNKIAIIQKLKVASKHLILNLKCEMQLFSDIPYDNCNYDKSTIIKYDMTATIIRMEWLQYIYIADSHDSTSKKFEPLNLLNQEL